MVSVILLKQIVFADHQMRSKKTIQAVIALCSRYIPVYMPLKRFFSIGRTSSTDRLKRKTTYARASVVKAES